MNLEVVKYSNGKNSTEYIEIEKMRNTLEPKNLLLVKEFNMNENNQEIYNIEIKKIQFIATCSSKIGQDIVVAFYVHDEGYLETFIISGLPDQYSSEMGFIVDYKSYSEICELTGEKRLSFIDYFEQIKNGYIGINTVAKFQDKFYNFTEQKEMWALVGK